MNPTARSLVLPLLALTAGCADGAASPTQAAPGGDLPVVAAAVAGSIAQAQAAFPDQELRLTHKNLELLITGSLLGEDPAGMGIYMDRPGGVGDLPMAVVYRQDRRNLWGSGVDANTNEPYPDFVSVFQSSAGDVFRFREGGSAVLGNGIGRPGAEHVLTLVDRNNRVVENVLNLAMSDDGHARRFLRAFDGTAIAWAVAKEGNTGVGKDYEDRVMMDIAGEARARAFLQVEDPVLATDVEEVVGVLDDVASLVPLRYTPTSGTDRRARYGLLDTFNQDALFPETVRRDGPDATRSVDYAQVTALLVAAVKELTARVEALEGGTVMGELPELCRPPERRRPTGSSTGR